MTAEDVPDGPILEVRGATKTYGSIVALDDVSFSLRPGEVHALLGHNGAGKSTLVKVLGGVVVPDSGDVLIGGEYVVLKSPRQAQQAGVAVVEQELSLVSTLTVQENILLGSVDTKGADPARIRTILATLGLDRVSPDTMVEDLSMGERQLVEIARALSRDARVLILDEPTASIGAREIDRVFSAVRGLVAEGRSVIFVSHRLGEVLELCSRVTVMRDGKVTVSRDVAGLDRASIVQLMLGDAVSAPSPKGPLQVDDTDRVMVHGLTVSGAVKPLDLTVGGGEIVGIAGQVGSGASEVVRALAGLIPEARGRVSVCGRPMRLGSPTRSNRVGVVFASSDRKGEGLFLSQSIANNLVSTRLRDVSTAGLLSPRRATALAQHLTDLIGVQRGRMRQKVETLSGGNQQKVFLGRCLERPGATFLLLDEPTRGVDVGGRAEIHNLVRRAASEGNAIIFVSTDHEEILELADTVVTMFSGQVTSIGRREETDAARVLAEMTQGATSVELRA